MSTPLVDEIAQHIRRIDGNNKMPATILGGRIADFLEGVTDGSPELRTRFVDFVERTNADKRTGAGRLAELIAAEFDLPEDGAE